ncbi:SiaB family protein kinase [Sediminitomix flava]|uniref:Uncharacterized protein n=1 Tax=Sediminitomix flava TaxID=379075 RepID=A0A315ZFE4_SEDFL|nr:SiaB family protein kinase [Sediminitomix flava]PWJ44285.1 hypothetical protein BC781_101635 [Sediminitomix flava]
MQLDIRFLKTALLLHDEMSENGISIIYMGALNQDFTKMFLAMTEDKMDRKNEKMKVKKRVYHMLVETLQNITRHSAEMSDNPKAGNGLFFIGQDEKAYYVITSNKIENEERKSLCANIDEVNNASEEELKEMYKTQIKSGDLNATGGAGLGLIDLRRKTKEPLQYQFVRLNQEHSLFLLKVSVAVSEEEVEAAV